jgi:hypothetical protein
MRVVGSTITTIISLKGEMMMVVTVSCLPTVAMIVLSLAQKNVYLLA